MRKKSWLRILCALLVAAMTMCILSGCDESDFTYTYTTTYTYWNYTVCNRTGTGIYSVEVQAGNADYELLGENTLRNREYTGELRYRISDKEVDILITDEYFDTYCFYDVRTDYLYADPIVYVYSDSWGINCISFYYATVGGGRATVDYYVDAVF